MVEAMKKTVTGVAIKAAKASALAMTEASEESKILFLQNIMHKKC